MQLSISLFPHNILHHNILRQHNYIYTPAQLYLKRKRIYFPTSIQKEVDNLKKTEFVLVSALLLVLFAGSVSAAVISGTDVTWSNVSSLTVLTAAVAGSGDIRWLKIPDVSLQTDHGAFMSGSNGYFNATGSNVYLTSAGYINNINDIYSTPAANATDPFSMGDTKKSVWKTVFPLYGTNDGFYVRDAQNRTGIFVVTAISGTSLTFSYKINNQSGNTTLAATPTTGCGAQATESACSTKPGCYWDSFASFCKESGGSSGSKVGAIGPDCPMFDNNQINCQNISVCQWTAAGSLCDNNHSVFNSSTGIVCSNIKNSTLCNNQAFTKPLCSWNGTGCAKNTTKSNTDVAAAPVTFCEAAKTNQTLCDQLRTTYFMPCKFDNKSTASTADDVCTFNFESVFSGGAGEDIFDACDTKTECDAVGGTWKSEQFSYTDGYGTTQVQTDEWCEFSFGDYEKESCDDACWACEFNSSGGSGTKVAWASQAAAKTACETSKSGICQFYADTNAFNSFGWCEPNKNLGFGFKNSCSNDCHGCFDNASCVASTQNCTWLVDSQSIDVNNDGQFNATSDGRCEQANLASVFDCNQDCQACAGQSACVASTKSGGCYFNPTYGTDVLGNIFAVCIANGTTPEVCYLPGDEDGDGLADCADTNPSGGDCTKSPACGANAGISFKNGNAIIVDPQTCIQHDNNQAACNAQNGTGPLGNTSVCFYHPVPGQETSFPTVGWCDPAGHNEFSEGIKLDTPPTILGIDTLGDVPASQAWLDVQGIGVKEDSGDGDKMFVGAQVSNITNFGGCNKIYTNSQNQTGVYYQFYDVDGNTSNGCSQSVTLRNGSTENQTGFEYHFLHFGNATSQIVNSFKCASGSWTPYSAKAEFFKEACGIVGISSDVAPQVHALGVNKADIGAPKKPMRLYYVTVNSSKNLSKPVDTAGPFYYSPGSVDVKFEDCSTPGADQDSDGLKSENDPDCQKFLKFGYTPFEGGPLCSNGKDDDNDGSTDCSDDTCKYDPFSKCTSGTVTCDATDKSAPQFTALKASAYPDGAFIDTKTNEVTNATVEFYSTDSKCATLNKTVLPFELLDGITGNEFVAFHGFPLDSNTLGSALTANRTYFYKATAQDICGNKLVSACQNFTTPTSAKEFVFKPVVPAGVSMDVPAFGVGNDTFTYGKKVNQSASKDFVMKYKNTTQGWSIGVNCTLLSQSTINATPIYTAVNSTTKYVGYNTSDWQKLQEICGSKPTTIEIPLSANGTTISNITKCDEKNLSNCVDVTKYLSSTCTISSSVATCTIPAGLGFSLYKADATGTSGGSSGSTGSTGGGGGGGGAGSKVECNDNKDNDGDGLVDYPKDPGCTTGADTTEKETTCTEDWTCTSWSDCTDDKQVRTCIDSNNCAGKTVDVVNKKDKPAEEQVCGAAAEAAAAEAKAAGAAPSGETGAAEEAAEEGVAKKAFSAQKKAALMIVGIAFLVVVVIYVIKIRTHRRFEELRQQRK